MLTKNVCPRLCPTSIKGNKIECEFYAQALNLQCSFFFLFTHTYIFSSNKNSDRWFRIQSTKFKFLHFVHFIHIKQDFFIETCIKIVKAHAKNNHKVNIYTANIIYTVETGTPVKKCTSYKHLPYTLQCT